jgi:hypothetical protein
MVFRFGIKKGLLAAAWFCKAKHVVKQRVALRRFGGMCLPLLLAGDSDTIFVSRQCTLG